MKSVIVSLFVLVLSCSLTFAGTTKKSASKSSAKGESCCMTKGSKASMDCKDAKGQCDMGKDGKMTMKSAKSSTDKKGCCSESGGAKADNSTKSKDDTGGKE